VGYGLWVIFWAGCGVWFVVGGLGAEGSDGGKVNKGLFGLAARFRAHTLMQVRKAGWLEGKAAVTPPRRTNVDLAFSRASGERST
jgi:hypothetical protein